MTCDGREHSIKAAAPPRSTIKRSQHKHKDNAATAAEVIPTDALFFLATPTHRPKRFLFLSLEHYTYEPVLRKAAAFDTGPIFRPCHSF